MTASGSSPFAWACLPVGWLETNCYLFWDTESKAAAVIDPGADEDAILEAIGSRQLRVVAIINTHGHGDHIAANRPLKAALGAPLYIHEKDSLILSDPRRNYSQQIGLPITSPAADIFLKAGDAVTVGRTDLKVLETPGHTPGSICLEAAGRILFSGDTLFAGSIGRTDLPEGDGLAMQASLRQLVRLPEAMAVFPGHGPATTIGRERLENPFLRENVR